MTLTGKPVRWDGEIVSLVVDEVESFGLFEPTDWSQRDSVKIMPDKGAGWPFLSITNLMSNSLVQVSWPAPLSGFTLQFRTSLSTDVSWTNDPGTKVVKGTNVTVIETNVGTQRFFRLTN